MIDAFKPVRDFEAALCEYTGAPYAVTVNSCTMAILLACAWQRIHSRHDYTVSIPHRTYVSVPMAIKMAGFKVDFHRKEWSGFYHLRDLHVWDCARCFTSLMFDQFHFGLTRYLCVSFHHSKILGDTQGGAILHNDSAADAWFRRARFDGRTEGVDPKDDTFNMLGYHCYMSPDVAARLLWKLSKLPKHNEPLPNDDYPDLSTMEIFK